MIIKKQFAMHEFIEEEEFLNQMASEGKCLKKALGEGFEFKECNSFHKKYKIFYSLSDYDPDIFQGFKLVTSYTSTKGGHYYYLEIIDPNAQLPENKDRNFMLERNLNRIEKFNGILVGSLFLLFTYLYITQQNPIYFIIIAGAIGLGSYIFRLRTKIKKAITK